jgi:hypothetical protein
MKTEYLEANYLLIFITGLAPIVGISLIAYVFLLLAGALDAPAMLNSIAVYIDELLGGTR